VLGRVRAPARTSGGQRALPADARSIRVALDGLRREAGGRNAVDLRRYIRDLLEGEVAAPTADVATLKRRGVDPGEFYEQEVKASWEGLSEAQRASALDGLMELCSMLRSAGDTDAAYRMGPTVRTKTLILAWAFDEAYGYLSMLERGELP
jgi:hypothetical protein